MQIVESTIEKWKLVSGPIGDVVKKIIHVVTEKSSGLYWFKVQNLNSRLSISYSLKNYKNIFTGL
jgi:hypothetical protein